MYFHRRIFERFSSKVSSFSGNFLWIVFLLKALFKFVLSFPFVNQYRARAEVKVDPKLLLISPEHVCPFWFPEIDGVEVEVPKADP